MDNLKKEIANLPIDKLDSLINKFTKEKKSENNITIKKVNRTTNIFPLSFSQKRIWFIEMLTPGTSMFNLPQAVRLRGELKYSALVSSLKQMVERHEILRTKIKIKDAEPVQYIEENNEVKIYQTEVLDIDPEKREEESIRFAKEEAATPFELIDNELWRCKLIKFADDDFILIITMHHIISDGWSLGLAFKELVTLYNKNVSGEEVNIDKLPIQYVDYSEWKSKQMDSDLIKNQLSYWKNKLQGNIPIIEIPTDYSRKAESVSNNGGYYNFSISNELNEKIVMVCKEEKVTPFMIMLSCFYILLFQYTGVNDICVGSPVANRNILETNNIIGLFVNMLAVRIDISGNPSFKELLGRVKKVVLEANANQDVPFEKVVEELGVGNDFDSSPLFQTMFSYNVTPSLKSIKLNNIDIQYINAKNVTAQYDLSMYATETDGQITCNIEYDSSLFKPDTIIRLENHYKNILSCIVDRPDCRLSEIDMLTEKEKAIIEELNDTEVEYPKDTCFYSLFEKTVDKFPDSIAVKFKDEELTYSELNKKVNKLAHYMERLGAKSGKAICICMDRSLEMVVGVLAIMKTGATYIPLDPNFPQKRKKYILENSKADIVITQSWLADEASEGNHKTICVDTEFEKIDLESEENDLREGRPNDIAYIIFTSGSTGNPKGVQISNRALVNFLYSMKDIPGATCNDTILAVTTLSFDIAGLELYLPLLVGGKVVIAEQELVSDSVGLTRLIDENNVSIMQATPATWKLLIDGGWQGRSKLKILCGGEALSKDLARKLVKMCSELWNVYGPTETTIWSGAYKVEDDDKPIYLGTPIANTTFHIVNSIGNETAINVPGELYIGGDGLALGYYNMPKLTKEKFIPDKFSKKEGARLYKTGDIVKYSENGDIQYIGRGDRQVKIRGFRIELDGIEVVIKKYPKIKEALITTCDNAIEEKEIVAFIVLKDGETATIEELRSFALNKLPRYMVPGAFVFIKEIPLTPNGKIDRKALPVPNLDRQNIRKEYEEPANEVEKQVARIFEEILSIQKVGRWDNFFDLGGHSLYAAKLIIKLKETINANLQLRILVENPTVAGIAKFIIESKDNISTKNHSNNLLLQIKNDSKLPENIRPKNIDNQINNDEEDLVLLTGATGFVGAYLLKELLVQTNKKIGCLVRSADKTSAFNRIKDNMQAYSLWDDSYKDRIITVVGDLSKTKFGLDDSEYNKLTEKVQSIYHNGAYVDFIHPYSELRDTNVLGTQEVIKLACESRIKPIHLVSTLYIFSARAYSNGTVIKEDNILNDISTLGLGYTQSKYVSEMLVLDAKKLGIPVSIYRLGRISGDSSSGACQTGDFFWNMVRACMEIKMAPKVDMIVDIAPVDYVAKSIVYISRDEKNLGINYHINNPKTLTLTEFIERLDELGYKFKQVSFQEWKERMFEAAKIDENSAASSMIPFLQGQQFDGSSIIYDSYNTIKAISEANIQCPQIDNNILDIYFKYFLSIGYFKIK